MQDNESLGIDAALNRKAKPIIPTIEYEATFFLQCGLTAGPESAIEQDTNPERA